MDAGTKLFDPFCYLPASFLPATVGRLPCLALNAPRLPVARHGPLTRATYEYEYLNEHKHDSEAVSRMDA